ncbi:unnamed protein product, partial [Allacma fusca]
MVMRVIPEDHQLIFGPLKAPGTHHLMLDT